MTQTILTAVNLYLAPGDWKSRARCNKSGSPKPVAHGGNPQDRAGSPTHWLGYTGETHLRGLKTFDFVLVHGGGLRLYSRDF